MQVLEMKSCNNDFQMLFFNERLVYSKYSYTLDINLELKEAINLVGIKRCTFFIFAKSLY